MPASHIASRTFYHLSNKFMIVMAVTVVVLALFADSSDAQRANARTIASKDVSTANARVVIDASKARGAYRNIRLVNTRGARIRFRDVQIIYADGTSDRVGRAFALRSGERTRVLNKGNALKFVDKVIVDIRQERRRRRAGRARLSLEGTQTRREARLRRGQGNTPGLSIDPGDHNVLFGYRNVGLDVDRDEIQIGENVGRFSHLRLNVFGNDVDVRDLRIDYADGSTQFIPLGTRIKKGAASEWFEVKSDQFIDKIVLIYRAQPGQRQSARIEVSGQYAKNWLDPSGEGRKFNDGWVLLGAETAGSIGYDTDTIKVGRNKGGFKELRLKVRDRSITLRELRVIYGNGQSDVFRLTQRVDPGELVGPLALPKGKSAIRKIVAKYRSRLFFGKGKGTAMVEVWGRH